MKFENDNVEIEYNPDFLPKKLSGKFRDELKKIIKEQTDTIASEIKDEFKKSEQDINQYLGMISEKVDEEVQRYSLIASGLAEDLISGEDGKDGKDGQDGYTPQYGKDFLTPNEIADIKAEIAVDVANILELQPFVVEYEDIKNKPDVATLSQLDHEVYKLEEQIKLIKKSISRNTRPIIGGKSPFTNVYKNGVLVGKTTEFNFAGSNVTIGADGKATITNTGGGGGSSFLTITESDLSSTSYYYYGGTDSLGDWKINRYNKDNVTDKTSANVSNNPTATTLSTAWTSRLSLNYA